VRYDVGMSRPREDFGVLLANASPLDTNLAKQLLEERGIPSLIHGPDFDVAGLGVAAHQSVREADLLVTRPALPEALRILTEAWGPEKVAESCPAFGALADDDPRR
jgi:hypothetical protein